jgi:hypothetical protein
MSRLDYHSSILPLNLLARVRARPRIRSLRLLRFGGLACAYARLRARDTANFGNFRAA